MWPKLLLQSNSKHSSALSPLPYPPDSRLPDSDALTSALLTQSVSKQSKKLNIHQQPHCFIALTHSNYERSSRHSGDLQVIVTFTAPTLCLQR